MNRSERIKSIREIIKRKKISSQEQLMSELLTAGFKVTQSTVSRDVELLNLIKVRDTDQNEYYSLKPNYLRDPHVGLIRVKLKFKENVVLVEKAKNILVIKTNPGEAQGVAAAIDGSNFESILGTVAGDDTIICVVDNDTNASRMMKMFKDM
jgi:transcriptional regulator of arginine metabolism